MNLNDLHRRLLQDVLEVGNDLPFVITGGYAVQAHGIVDRLSRDIDVATNSSIPMEILASRLIEGLTGRGWQVHVVGIEPVSARFMVTDPELGEDCEVDILKEGFNWPPIDTPYGPVLSFDDVIGTKVRALADRGYARDLIDIHAASRMRSQAEMEWLGHLLAWDEFSLEGLATRLSSAQWRADEEFAAYGLIEAEITDLKRWAQAWADDINQRIYRDTIEDDELPLSPFGQPRVPLRSTLQQAARTRWLAQRGVPGGLGFPSRRRIRRAGSARQPGR
jgi:predicted nucleotidyltransferase component of viral defense system